MIQQIKSRIGSYLVNNLGWKTNQKIIVFESDDWGSKSIPDLNTFSILLNKGIRVDSNPYLKYDGLASTEDLEILFNTLSGFKDSQGKNPVFTLNTNVANPNFEKIEENRFEQYYYEPFTETLQKYSHTFNAFNLWEEGISNRLIEPQFHGREHLNPLLWLKQLRLNKHKDILTAFNYGVCTVPKSSYPNENWILNSAFYPNDHEEQENMFESINSGVDLFKEIFFYYPTSFIATGYFWNSDIEELLSKRGIKSIQGLPIQKEPDFRKETIKKTLNYTGKRNKYGQVYLIRNAFFEPTLNPQKDVVSDCLKRIEESFKNSKPAIIGTHRLNYIGSLRPENRDNNIILLNNLLKNIILRWPEVVFMSNGELSNLIIDE